MKSSLLTALKIGSVFETCLCESSTIGVRAVWHHYDFMRKNQPAIAGFCCGESAVQINDGE